MKLKISFLSLLVAFATVAFAQEEAKTYSDVAGYKTAYKYSGTSKGWFIQLGAGAQMVAAEGFSDVFFKSSQLTLAPTFAVGKWFNPNFGFRLKGQGGSLHSFPYADHSDMLSKKYYNGHLDLMWNMSNYFCKYNAKRVFSFIPYVGLGGVYREKISEMPGQDIPSAWDFTINGGLLFEFRFSQLFGMHLDLSAMAVNDRFSGIVGKNSNDVVAAATAGFTFNFGQPFQVVDEMDYALINDLNGKINSLRAENDLLSKRPVSCPECPKAAPVVEVKKEVEMTPYMVNFRIGSAVVDKDQQINIYNTSEFAKATGEKIKVIGYADKKTGTDSYNLKLSEKRAKAVAKELTSKYGIPSDNIVVEWKGAGEQPFAKENSWNRVVIMTAQ